MGTIINSFEQLAANSKEYARLLLIIGENRIELLAVEMQEELQRLLRMILLVLCVSVFGLLAGISLTLALVIVFDEFPPANILLSLTGFYVVLALCLYWRLARLLQNWQILSASINQIRKDRICRTHILA